MHELTNLAFARTHEENGSRYVKSEICSSALIQPTKREHLNCTDIPADSRLQDEIHWNNSLSAFIKKEAQDTGLQIGIIKTEMPSTIRHVQSLLLGTREAYVETGLGSERKLLSIESACSSSTTERSSLSRGLNPLCPRFSSACIDSRIVANMGSSSEDGHREGKANRTEGVSYIKQETMFEIEHSDSNDGRDFPCSSQERVDLWSGGDTRGVNFEDMRSLEKSLSHPGRGSVTATYAATDDELRSQWGLHECAVVLETLPMTTDNHRAGSRKPNGSLELEENTRKQALCFENSKTKRQSDSDTDSLPLDHKSPVCDTCGKRFKHASQLEIHLCSHSGEKAFQCYLCGIPFVRKGDLGRHLQSHTSGKSFRCEVCKATFTRASSVTRHMLTHRGDKPYECDVRHKHFSQSGVLNRHKLSHIFDQGEATASRCTGKHELHPCDECHSHTSPSSSLRRRTVTPFAVCQSCGGDFIKCPCDSKAPRVQRRGALESHEHLNSGASSRTAYALPAKRHECPVCGTMFAQPGTRNRHMRTHTGEKPFRCRHGRCTAHFAQSQDLKRHHLVHSGEKPYRCKLCPARFSQISHIRSHVRSHIVKQMLFKR